MSDNPPDDYLRFVIDSVSSAGENLTIRYSGRVFGGIVRCLLKPNGLEYALRPGAEIFVRYHTAETGAPGQVAHIITRNPSDEGWAEVYSDEL